MATQMAGKLMKIRVLMAAVKKQIQSKKFDVATCQRDAAFVLITLLQVSQFLA